MINFIILHSRRHAAIIVANELYWPLTKHLAPEWRLLPRPLQKLPRVQVQRPPVALCYHSNSFPTSVMNFSQLTRRVKSNSSYSTFLLRLFYLNYWS